KNIDRHSSYKEYSKKTCDNFAIHTMYCDQAEFSESPNTFLLPRMKARVLSLLQDSGYVTYPYENAHEFLMKKNRLKKLRKGNIFPITQFETIDGQNFDLSKNPSKRTFLVFTTMSGDPCGREIPGI